MWRRCAIGVPLSKRLGLMTPNGAVKRALRKTDPVKRTARNTSDRISRASHAAAGDPAKQGNVLVIASLGLQRKPLSAWAGGEGWLSVAAAVAMTGSVNGWSC